MNYSKRSLLLYKDEPPYGLLKLLIIIPASFLIISVYLWSVGEQEGSLTLFFSAFFIIFIFWAVLPRRYEVYEDHLRIVLGGPFAVKVKFNEIKLVEVTSRTYATMNFVTTLTKTYVRILKKSGISVAITPRSNQLFAENANRALGQWAKRQSGNLVTK